MSTVFESLTTISIMVVCPCYESVKKINPHFLRLGSDIAEHVKFI